MVTIVAIAFLLGTVFLIGLFLNESLSFGKAMPFSCLVCGFGGDEDLAGRHAEWFALTGRERVRCRKCGARFKEHPNGMLVEDKD